MTDLVPREFSFDIHADIELVWEALTTADGLASWYVARASVDPQVGGDLEVDWGTGSYAMGTFDVVDSPNRIRLVYGEPEVGTEEWVLNHKDGVTHVLLVHSLPVEDGETWDDRYADITRGWLLFHSTLVWVAAVVAELGRRSEVRLGSIAVDAWPRVLAVLGVAATPQPGSTVHIGGLPRGEVLVAVDGYSLLIAFGNRATLLVDVEGSTLYTLAATYGEETDDTRRLRISLTDLAERLCAAAAADPRSTD
jgi:uncharacterized protein YndB with AHSA1/START domain